MEDVVIYLSSLGKDNSITKDILVNTYKQWCLAHQKSTLATARERMYPVPPPCLRFPILGASMVEAALVYFLSVFSSFGLPWVGQDSGIPKPSDQLRSKVFS